MGNSITVQDDNVAIVAGISSNITTVAGVASDVTTVAGISAAVSAVNSNATNINAVNSNSSNINAVASNSSNINTVASNNSNITTVATNVSGINDFADRYRVASSAPSSNNDEGDLYYNTTSDQLFVYNGSAWISAALDASSALVPGNNLSDVASASTARTNLGLGDAATKTVGISNGNVPTFTSGVADNDFLKINGTTVEGRSASEVLSDIGGQASLTFGISSGNVPTFTSGVVDNDFLRIDGTTIEGRSASEVASDIGISTFGATLVDDASASAARTTLGLGSLSTLSSVAQSNIDGEAINESKLQVSNAPTNGYFLQAQSGNTGGLTWAEVASGSSFTTDVDVNKNDPKVTLKDANATNTNSRTEISHDNDSLKIHSVNESSSALEYGNIYINQSNDNHERTVLRFGSRGEAYFNGSYGNAGDVLTSNGQSQARWLAPNSPPWKIITQGSFSNVSTIDTDISGGDITRITLWDLYASNQYIYLAAYFRSGSSNRTLKQVYRHYSSNVSSPTTVSYNSSAAGRLASNPSTKSTSSSGNHMGNNHELTVIRPSSYSSTGFQRQTVGICKSWGYNTSSTTNYLETTEAVMAPTTDDFVHTIRIMNSAGSFSSSYYFSGYYKVEKLEHF